MKYYPNSEMAGVGVTWQFCRYLDKLLNLDNAEQYRDLVALGNDADMMSLRSIETKHLISTGLASPRNPFIVKMAERNDYSLKGKLTPIGVAFYIAPFVNSMTRSGSVEQKQLLFESMLKHKAFIDLPSTKRGHALGQTETLVEQAVRVATNVKNRQTKNQDEFMEKVEKRIEENHLLNHKVLLFLLKPGEVDRNIAGLVANKIMSKYQRPVCMLTQVEESYTEDHYPDETGIPWKETEFITKIFYAGSARGCDKTGVTDFKQICLDTGVVEYAQGHPGAFGVKIDVCKINEFIAKTDELLKDMTDEAIYYVDYIFDTYNINPNAILDIADMDDLWGKDVDEPYIALKNIKISPEMVTIYDKKGYTIKIALHTGISILKFNATEEDCQIFQTNNSGFIEVNIIGRCNRNDWNGYITPQIFMQDYEIVDANKYYF